MDMAKKSASLVVTNADSLNNRDTVEELVNTELLKTV